MMQYLAIVIEGLVTPFIMAGELIGNAVRAVYKGIKTAYGWVQRGIEQAWYVDDDIYLTISYWTVYIIGLLALSCSPLLLLLFNTTGTTIAAIATSVVASLIILIKGISILYWDT